MPSSRTDWHEAITCVIQIDLRDYSHLLEYKTEHFLSVNGNRIDLLIIRKKPDIHIPKHIASLFRSHNLFEYKGFGSSLTVGAYYKTNGHAGYYIDSCSEANTLNRKDITLTFPTFHYPRKLFKHLAKDCQKTIENPFPRVYYIKDEMYATQVLVIDELLPDDSLYLSCLSQSLMDQALVGTLADDYALNRNNSLYIKYMNQFIRSHRKGEQLMVCEELFRLYGTSSEEVAEKARAEYIVKIQKLTSENHTLSSENTLLTAELDKLKHLLDQNNIAY